MADDFAELRELAADLTAAPEEARPFIRKAVQVTSHKIKDDWRDNDFLLNNFGFQK